MAPTRDFTVAELRDVLRENSLPIGGTKAELMQRVNEAGRDLWSALSERRERSHSVDLVDRSNGGSGDVSEAGTLRGELENGLTHSVDTLQTELILLRREKELWERERQLLLREQELARCSPTSVSIGGAGGGALAAVGGIRGIKDLLPEFDASDNTFWRWRDQLEYLQQTYHLDDDLTRTLVGSRLRGRALAWFYSRAEHITLTMDSLLKEMEQMFGLREGKLSLRRRFEARVWKRGESFADYYCEKIILANRVPICACLSG